MGKSDISDFPMLAGQSLSILVSINQDREAFFMTDQFLDTKQAAQYLGLKKNTLDVWRLRGGGPIFCKFGRAVRYRKQDLDAFVEKNRVTSTSQVRIEG
jgi:excisionase family DNA binding protein